MEINMLSASSPRVTWLKGTIKDTKALRPFNPTFFFFSFTSVIFLEGDILLKVT